MQGLNQQRVSLPYALLLLSAVAQAIAIIITWPLWNVRSDGLPHLPVFDGLPQVPFGMMLLVTLAVLPVRPRVGVWGHFAVMLVACLFDQMRTQPQFLATWILMVAVTYPVGAALTRWFLASLWIWAGLHKLISPDWMSHRSWSMADKLGLEPESFSFTVAISVALLEILVGLLACFKPRWAAPGCVALHVGIVIYLSPWVRDWNYSVFPWNLATAVIGFWILWKAKDGDWFITSGKPWVSPEQKPAGETTCNDSSNSHAVNSPIRNNRRASRRWWFERIAFAAMMIVPAGFYIGLLDHGYAHVLYSDSIPRGLISRNDGSLVEIKAWGELAIPFPNERRLLKQHFGEVAQQGEKLHVRDPRPRLDDLHFLMTETGPVEISRQHFFSDMKMTAGFELDSKRAKYFFDRANVTRLKRERAGMVWAIQFSPENFDSKLFKHLNGISNLEQVVLDDTDFDDADVALLPPLPRLTGIGLSRTKITDKGIQQLIVDRKRKFPRLKYIVADETEVSGQLLRRFNESR